MRTIRTGITIYRTQQKKTNGKARMATQTETEMLNGEFLWQQNGNDKGFQKVIDNKIEMLAERYEHGEDLWTGKPLCIESEVEIEFRPAIDLITNQ